MNNFSKLLNKYSTEIGFVLGISILSAAFYAMGKTGILLTVLTGIFIGCAVAFAFSVVLYVLVERYDLPDISCMIMGTSMIVIIILATLIYTYWNW